MWAPEIDAFAQTPPSRGVVVIDYWLFEPPYGSFFFQFQKAPVSEDDSGVISITRKKRDELYI